MKRILFAIRCLWPPLGRLLTWRDFLSPVLFGALFAATCVTLELLHIVMFGVPRAFLLSPLLIWVWWIHLCGSSGMTSGARELALWVRLLLVAAFITVLAEPQAVRSSDDMVVIYALDVSDSIGDEVQAKALGYVVKTANAKPARDKAGLVVFGQSAAVELPPRKSFPFEAVNVKVSRDGTAMARALMLCRAMLPETNPGRIVLLSDGAQTEGDAAAVLADLASSGVRVDVLPVSYEHQKEVWLERLDLPRVVKSGETYEASVVLSSLTEGSGTLTLNENGQEILRQGVEYREGKNRFVLPLYMRSAGFYEYTARILPPEGEDGWRQNNIAVNHLFLQGEGRVLVVAGSAGGEEQTRWLVKAMRESGLLVDVKSPYELPMNSLGFLPYDTIVLANVAADELDAMRIAAMHDAVDMQGSGFLMLGGDNSFGAGGYSHTPIEELLPVSMDIKKRKALPKGALAIVLHTCEFAQGNTWGKRIAKEAMRVLGPEDEVGVLVYSWGSGTTGEQWLFPLTPASEYERLVPLVNSAQIGDMPSFATTMQLGYDGLAASDAAALHMIIISDGDPSPPSPVLLRKFVKAGITVSTVAINPHGGVEQSIMSRIAASTGGRYYFPQDPNQLPAIFVKEAKTLRRNLIQNRTFTPVQSFPSSIMKGITAVPELHGLVLATPKPRAEVILEAPEGEETDPLLVTWRYGLGTTAAFTSDLSANWGRDWVKWEQYRAFVRQLIGAIGRIERPSNLFVSVRAEGAKARVLVEDHHPDAGFLEIEAEAGPSGGETIPVELRQVGPRLYEGEFSLSGSGRYQLIVAGSGDGRSERASASLMVPYSPEYLRFRSDPLLLQRIADETGGRVLTGAEDGEQLFNADREVRRTTQPIVDWFLWALAILLPLDVAVRRVRIDWAAVAARFSRKKVAKSTATLAALMKQKREHEPDSESVQRAREALKHSAFTAPTPAETPSPERSAPQPTRAAQAEETKETPEEPTSTTGRLLARKRQWKDKDE